MQHPVHRPHSQDPSSKASAQSATEHVGPKGLAEGILCRFQLFAILFCQTSFSNLWAWHGLCGEIVEALAVQVVDDRTVTVMPDLNRTTCAPLFAISLRGRFIVSLTRLMVCWSSSCPGKSWHFLMICAQRALPWGGKN